MNCNLLITNQRRCGFAAVALVAFMTRGVFAQAAELSHAPLRTVSKSPVRPMAQGRLYFADAANGQDDADGTKSKPWRTLQHAVNQLSAGDTLYLRGGTYYENIRVSLRGKKNAPITICSYPGEQAVLDGGVAEFFNNSSDAWEPYPAGAAGEFRSTRPLRNARNVVGRFGDSMIGLQSYYHVSDLRATNEINRPNKNGNDVADLYCGPGIWYDAQSGHVHIRLQHTHLTEFDNYQGETDPRKLPLVIVPYRSIPLHIDGARHVRLQDLVIRGGGYDTVIMDQSVGVDFDNVTVWCGTYGLRAKGVRQFRFYRSALYGSIAPWTTRHDSSLNAYPGRTTRDIMRLNTHALLVTDANGEFSVYHYPFNDDWEIAYSEFSEASDGLYLGGIGLRFHHNLIDNMQDDGIYLSPMFERHRVFGGGATLNMYQNRFSKCLTTLAFGGTFPTDDTVFFYRNIVDLRKPILTGRPKAESSQFMSFTGQLISDHGSPPWSSMNAYHNTFLKAASSRSPDMWMARGAVEGRPRKVFNNAFVHFNRMPPLQLRDTPHLQSDGNLYWYPDIDAKLAETYLSKFRSSPVFEKSKTVYPPGFEANSLIADPQFRILESNPDIANDYRPQAGSPLINAGVNVPKDWPDPLRSADQGKPDIGALPLGAGKLNVGRSAKGE